MRTTPRYAEAEGVASWRELLSCAVNAALAGGRAAMEVYARDFSVAYKEDRSPLTDADRASQNSILSALRETCIPVVSEESESVSYQTRRGWRSLWLVDPLDGTKEFVKKNGEFTVNIALVSRERAVLGVVYVPATRDLFAGVDGVGAFRTSVTDGVPPWDGAESVGRDANGRWAKLDVASLPADGALRVAVSRSHGSPETEMFIDRLRESGRPVETVSRGSALKLCMIATGEAAVYPRLAPTMEWDTAAAQAVVEAAGGRVVVYDETLHEAYRGAEGPDALLRAQPLRYNKESLLNPWFVAFRASLAE